MTTQQFHALCIGIQQIGSGSGDVVRLIKDLPEEDKLIGIKMLGFVRIITDCNEELSKITDEIKTSD